MRADTPILFSVVFSSDVLLIFTKKASDQPRTCFIHLFPFPSYSWHSIIVYWNPENTSSQVETMLCIHQLPNSVLSSKVLLPTQVICWIQTLFKQSVFHRLKAQWKFWAIISLIFWDEFVCLLWARSCSTVEL